VRLVGHSLGGNVVMHYAGSRPGRVRALVSLEGFGIPFETAAVAPRKMHNWLDALRDPPTFRPYATLAEVADRLQKTNPRLPRDKSEFLARHWAAATPQGGVALTSDPRHKLPFPTVYRMEEIFAVWESISAPALWIAAAQSDIPRWLDAHPEGGMGADGLDGVRRRIAHVPGATLAIVDDAGHMLHHDQPEAVARAIEPFLRAR
jgi:pimeloyl-ACP methyl ester carboxylesterase